MLTPNLRTAICLAVALAATACSKSDSTGTGGDPGTVGSATTCAKSQIEILFSPMFSAFDGVHRFQVPATVNSIDPSAITWSISDPTLANLQTNADGVMITVQKAGTANIIATAGTLCGSAPLTVTAATADHWMVGSARYTSGQVLTSARAAAAWGSPGTGWHGRGAWARATWPAPAATATRRPPGRSRRSRTRRCRPRASATTS